VKVFVLLTGERNVADAKNQGPIFVAPGTELLGLIRQFEVSRLVELSSRLDKNVRHRVKEESQLFFRHYGRLKWLIEKHGFVATPELMWGTFMVLLKGADSLQIAKVIRCRKKGGGKIDL
jgi:hypothetical protein